jgi:hypothetical protein
VKATYHNIAVQKPMAQVKGKIAPPLEKGDFIRRMFGEDFCRKSLFVTKTDFGQEW